MHLPKKWWIGLPVLFGLAYFAQGALAPRLEDDLRAAILLRVAQSPDAIDRPEVRVVGRDVVLAGISLSPDVKAQLLTALGVETPARRIMDATQPLSRATPFVLRLERRGGKAMISGNVPPTGAREKLRAEIAALGLEVSDSAAYADGAPKSFPDLASFAVRRLAELDPATTTMTDANLAVSGEARSAADYGKALAALKASPFESAVKVDVSPPRVSPYVFSAAARDGVISLSGHLPSDDLRKQVVAMAASVGAGAAVSDATELGAGAPAGDFAGALAFAVSELGKLSQGKVAVSDGKIIIEGQGRQNILGETIRADAKARLPSGFEIARLDVTAGPITPYVFSAQRAGGDVTLTGYAPDESVRNRLVETARRNFFDAKVVDRLVIAKGAPQNFAEAMDHALAALARLDEGKLAISDSNISLAGVARHQNARAEIAASFADALPQSFRGEAQLSTRIVGSPLVASQCAAALADLLAKSPIVFVSDDSAIAAESAPLVDAIAATALRCPGATLEIAAHTDNVGIAEVNLGRSKRRAQALVERLAKAGVDPFRTIAVGYGGERPIASNDSDENRARNRRVEIVVK
ncbi:OmpA family protein [Methylocystis silviterrae]|uniref:OmpA family protein n=1 Tax=Methylocystis silviterrae TaxID=2743612 RepID=UPI001E3ADF78|nr:OmpA family protein [Methylocystis silviterrae]